MSEEMCLQEQELLTRHKKERKELQGFYFLIVSSFFLFYLLLIEKNILLCVSAKIQVLKKSTCKGDKKKKKEITEEVLKMESDLDKKQNQDLAEFKLQKMNLDSKKVQDENDTQTKDENVIDDSNSLEESKTPRVSKAQRRREKKEIAEKERNQRITEQEALNEFGERNIEIQSIKSTLLKQNLMIHEIPSDGHWLVINKLKKIIFPNYY